MHRPEVKFNLLAEASGAFSVVTRKPVNHLLDMNWVKKAYNVG